MSVKTVHTAKAPAAIGPYSQGTIANGFLYTAGQIPIDPATGETIDGDIVAQTERVMKNLEAILTEAGATWKDVVKTTVYMLDLSEFPRMNDVYGRAFGDARPARSTVQVSALPRAVMVEIDLVAALPARS